MVTATHTKNSLLEAWVEEVRSITNPDSIVCCDGSEREFAFPTGCPECGEPVEKAHYERSDISVVPAAGVVGEGMVALTIADFILDKFGGDSLAETRDNLARYRARIGEGAGGGAGRRAAGGVCDGAAQGSTLFHGSCQYIAPARISD